MMIGLDSLLYVGEIPGETGDIILDSLMVSGHSLLHLTRSKPSNNFNLLCLGWEVSLPKSNFVLYISLKVLKIIYLT